MKPFCIALFTVALAQFSAGADPRPSSDVEIRFCPAARVHTYPLESQRDIHSLLLQNMAVINHGSTLFKIEGIDLELLQAGQVVDSRKLDSAAAQRFAERGAKTQGAGMIEAVAFKFCGTDLIAPDVQVTGPSLEKDQALLITSQVFAFSGKRDTLRARARGSLDGRAHEIAATLPIRSEFAKNSYIFPLRGVWYAGVGASLHTGHRWAIPEEFGLDIGKTGGDGRSFKGDGTRFEDYFAPRGCGWSCREPGKRRTGRCWRHAMH
ncbi:MAG: hypothetical protein M3Q89_00375 [Verrucomicrobiota bacterium]|nr:hypothetical protein [Verrucomicrobiota bacterium]